jgi:hypothetical protein
MCEIISEIEGAADILMCLLFLFEMLFELGDPALEVAIDVDVARDDALHSAHILVDVVLHGAYSLHV